MEMKRLFEAGIIVGITVVALGCEESGGTANAHISSSLTSSGQANLGPIPKGGGSASSGITATSYGGGPILAPEIVSIYWGNFTQAQITAQQSYLQGLATYISGTTAPQGQEPTIWQYGVYGARVGGFMSDTTLPSHGGQSGHASDSDVRAEITKLQGLGLSAFGPERVFMVFTSGITFDAGAANWPSPAGTGYCGDPNVTGACFCGFHDAIANNQWYGLVPFPYVPTGGSDSCGAAGFGSFDATGVWQMITSHEASEAATDPAAFSGVANNGWSPEIGDQCSWGSNLIQMSFGVIENVVDDLQSTCSIWTKQQFPQTSVASWAPGRMDAFSLWTDRSYQHINFTQSGGWSGWEPHGGAFVGPPVVTSWGANELDVFGQGTDGAYYQQHFNGTAWQPSVTTWSYHGGSFIGQPAVVSWGANRVDAFGVGTDGALYHQAFDGTQWLPSPTTWEFLGGQITGKPAVASWGANRLDIFVEGPDGAYYHKDWNGTAWEPSMTGWERHAGVFIGPPALSSWGANELDVFGQGTDGAYYLQHFNGTAWQPSLTTWEAHGGVFIGPPATVSWGSGILDVYGQGTDGAYYHQHFNGAVWQPSVTTWEAHGGSFVSGPALSSWGSNTLAAFGTDATGGGDLLLQDWQGFWSPSQTTWASLGGTVH